MPAMIAQPGMPVWLDLATNDAPAARAFYSELLGWEFDEAAGADAGYCVAKKDGMPVAGVAQVPEGNRSVWGLMLYTPDVAQAHDLAVGSGAQSVLEPRDLGERGQMAVIVDPSGATVGLRNPADEHALFAAGEPATPVWHELMVSANWEQTLEFYHQLAGWDIRALNSEDPDFRYAVGEYDGAPLVGLWDTSRMQVQGEGASSMPSMWTIYMGVVDIDAAVSATQRLGGEVIRPAWESDFGRMATIQDPTGALLNLCEVAEFVPDPEEDHEPDLFAPEEFKPH